MSKQVVYLLGIEHKHGTDFSVYSTEAGALQALWDYVDDNWSREADGKPAPEGEQAKLEAYFSLEIAGGYESYLLERLEVADLRSRATSDEWMPQARAADLPECL